MRTFVLSLRRLYMKQSITKEKLDGLLDEGKITQDEYDYIIAE